MKNRPHPSLSCFRRRGPGGQVDPCADGVAPAVPAPRQEGLHPAVHAQERQPAQRPAQALAQTHIFEVSSTAALI